MNVFSICLFLYFLATCKAECPNNLLSRNNILYILSSETSQYDDGEQTCQSMGGEIARISEASDREFFKPFLNEIYMKGLVDVIITRNFSRENIYYYKFKAVGIPNGENQTVDYQRPPNGEISLIKLYKNPTGSFNKPVVFYYLPLRDMIRSPNNPGPSGSSFYFDFTLYGGNSPNMNSITIYNYWLNPLVRTSLLTFSSTTPTGWAPSYLARYVLITDIAIFIGAKSDNGETNWFWNNGSLVNNSYFLSTSACQQMTWPLTYEDGINLRVKSCNEQSHYICMKNFLISSKLEENKCDPTSLKLTWDPEFWLNISDLLTPYLQQIIKIEIGSSIQVHNITVNQTEVKIYGLEEDTTYEADIEFGLHNCSRVRFSASASGRTSKSLQPVIATASRTSDICTIDWSQNDSGNVAYQLRIVGNSGSNKTVLLQSPSYKINITKLGYVTPLTLMIIAEKSCGKSFEHEVTGNCFVHNFPITEIAIALASVVIVVLVTILIIRRKLGVKNKTTYNTRSSTRRRKTEIHRQSLPPTPANTGSKPAQKTTRLNGKETRTTDRLPPVPVQTTAPTVVEYVGIYENNSCSKSYLTGDNLEQFYTNQSQSGFTVLNTQFKDMKMICEKSCSSHSKAVTNKKKNRYKNVYPYDHAALLLKDQGYINAAYIEGYGNPKKYIATQGPKPNTINDFWEMVWMQDCSIIVMLCKCTEKRKTKCETYWPLPKTGQDYNNLHITSEDAVTTRDIIRRDFLLTCLLSGDQKTVVQFQYIGWPDHGIPTTTTSMSKLRKLVNSEYDIRRNQRPIIIHCSAGAGRTGTYILTDNLIDALEKTKSMDPMKEVLKMRENRTDMVQTVEQYAFAYKLVMENFILHNTELTVNQFQQHLKDDKLIDHRASEEHSYLMNPIFSTPVIIKKNEIEDDAGLYNNLKPVMKHSPNQVVILSDQDCIYADAHGIQLQYFLGSLIVSAPPVGGKEDQFWKMVLQHRLSYVVSLEEENSFAYILSTTEGVLQYSNIRIVLESVDNNSDRTSYKLLLSSDDAAASLEVDYVLIKKPETQRFPSISALLQLWDDIKSNIQCNNFVLIHCNDGRNYSGLFLTAMVVIEQIKSERRIDIFRTAKDLKDYRSALLQTRQFYVEIYKLVREYINYAAEEASRSVYGNV